jgi:hypothetical protein
MDVTPTCGCDLAERRLEKIVPHMVGLGASIRANHYLDTPDAVTAAQLCVADEGPSAALTGHEPCESGAPAVHEVQPLVFAQRTVLVRARHLIEQQGHFSDVVLAHPAFHFYVRHSGEATDPH